MASASSSCQGLLEKISPGSPQDLLLEEAVHARIYDENVCPGTSADVLCEPAQSKGTCTSHKSNFVREVTGRMPGPNPGTRVLHEPAQSKCTWTSHKSHCLCKNLRGKCVAERNAHGHVTRAILCENLQEQCRRPESVPDPTPALTPTVRTPQCGQTVWGKTAWLTDRVPKIGVVWVIIFLNKPGMQ